MRGSYNIKGGRVGLVNYNIAADSFFSESKFFINGVMEISSYLRL